MSPATPTGSSPGAERLPFATERQLLVYEPETEELLMRLLEQGLAGVPPRGPAPRSRRRDPAIDVTKLASGSARSGCIRRRRPAASSLDDAVPRQGDGVSGLAEAQGSAGALRDGWRMARSARCSGASNRISRACAPDSPSSCACGACSPPSCSESGGRSAASDSWSGSLQPRHGASAHRALIPPLSGIGDAAHAACAASGGHRRTIAVAKLRS